MRPANELVRDALRPLYRGTERAVRRWFPSQYDNLEWNRKMAEGYARRAQPGGAALGEEWSRPEDLDEILEEFLFPFVDERSAVAEIGVGGGRVAARVLPRVAKLYAFDISPRMLRAARSALAGRGEVEYVLLREPRLPEELTGALDLVYSFATFLHLDLHMMHRYIAETAR